MDLFDEYSKRLKVSEKGSRVGMEARINAALDADEMVRESRGRLEDFLQAYLTDRQPDIELARGYRADGTKESIVARIERDVQEVATIGQRKGSPTSLLLDDLRILLASHHRLTGEWTSTPE